MTAKVQSIISYLTLIGWLIAYFGGEENHTDLSRYHFKQSLGFAITMFIFGFVLGIIIVILPKIGYLIYSLISILFLVLTIVGIINAVKEEKKPLPFIGKYFEDQFAFIDK